MSDACLSVLHSCAQGALRVCFFVSLSVPCVFVCSLFVSLSVRLCVFVCLFLYLCTIFIVVLYLSVYVFVVSVCVFVYLWLFFCSFLFVPLFHSVCVFVSFCLCLYFVYLFQVVLCIFQTSLSALVAWNIAPDAASSTALQKSMDVFPCRFLTDVLKYLFCLC